MGRSCSVPSDAGCHSDRIVPHTRALERLRRTATQSAARGCPLHESESVDRGSTRPRRPSLRHQHERRRRGHEPPSRSHDDRGVPCLRQVVVPQQGGSRKPPCRRPLSPGAPGSPTRREAVATAVAVVVADPRTQVTAGDLRGHPRPAHGPTRRIALCYVPRRRPLPCVATVATGPGGPAWYRKFLESPTVVPWRWSPASPGPADAGSDPPRELMVTVTRSTRRRSARRRAPDRGGHGDARLTGEGCQG
jgi:hypothetical protein